MRLLSMIVVALLLTGCGDIAKYPLGIERDLEFYLPADKNTDNKEVVFFTFHNVIKYDDLLMDDNEFEVWIRHQGNIDSFQFKLDFEWSRHLKPRWKK